MKNKYIKEDLLVISSELKTMGMGKNTFLVTGATGLIGSLLLKSFFEYNIMYPEDKINVVAMARNERKTLLVYQDYFSSFEEAEKKGINFVFQDICENIQFKDKCDYIIHTANATNSKYFITNPVEVIHSIYTGTKNVLEYAKSVKTKGMVYLSSMEVFGQVDIERRISENELGYLDIQNTRSCYSEGKRLAECLCKSYSEEYGLNVKTARLAQTFGAGVLPNENRVFAQFARSVLNSQNIVLHTTGESMGNYCYTTDAIRAILLLLNYGENGETYTIVNENMTMPIKDMAKLVVDEFSSGKSEVVFDIPISNVFGYAPQTKMCLSGKKIEKLGWKPRVGMIEAYRRMLPSLI